MMTDCPESINRPGLGCLVHRAVQPVIGGHLRSPGNTCGAFCTRSPCALTPVRVAGISTISLVQLVHHQSCPGNSGTNRVIESCASPLKSPSLSRLALLAAKIGFRNNVISTLLAELKDKSFAALRSSADKPLCLRPPWLPVQQPPNLPLFL